MKKLTLDLDQLAVESFDTTRPASGRQGTVQGNMYCCCCCCAPCCCSPQPTADASCNGTCDASCGGTCVDCGGGGGYTDVGCTAYDATCRNYGSCGYAQCADIP